MSALTPGLCLRVVLKFDNRDILLNDLCLNDKHMSYMQLLLQNNFHLF